LTVEFQTLCDQKISPFGESGSSKKIADLIATTNLESLFPKRFHDFSNGEN
jgi:hypothetical protein